LSELGSTSTCASEKIASLDPYVGTISVSGSSVTPKRRAHQPATALRSSGSPCASGYGERSGRASTSALRDHRIGRLVRVALAEVDHVDALFDEAAPRLFEADERVGRHSRERGRDRDHALDAIEERAERLVAPLEARDRDLLVDRMGVGELRPARS